MRLVLFVEPEPVEAVLAVLEMVLDMVCGCQVNVLPKHWNSAPEGSVALPATTLRVSGATVWDEAAPRGVNALSAPRRAVGRGARLVSCAGYESYAQDSAEPVFGA